jgi:hypothetical protein
MGSSGSLRSFWCPCALPTLFMALSVRAYLIAVIVGAFYLRKS